MTQTEESQWRHPYMKVFAAEKNETGKFGRIHFLSRRICLKGFAIVVGGPNYLRTCYRDLARMVDGSTVQTDMTRLPAIPTVRRQSHRSMALHSYLQEVIYQLAENDPVNGKKIITVSFVSIELRDLTLMCIAPGQGVTFQTIYAMYLADVDSLGDELLLSETTVRKAWNEVMGSMNVSLRSNPMMSKCTVCLSLRTRLLKVSLSVPPRTFCSDRFRCERI